MIPPTLEPEADWEPFELPFEIGSGRSMFVETEAGPTIRMRCFRRRGDGSLVGRTWFGEAASGPPGFVHGGALSYVLDEAMGTAAWLAGYPSMAANLNLDFLEMTPLGEVCLLQARVERLRTKKLELTAALSLGDRCLVRGRGLFVRLNRNRIEKMSREVGIELPDLSGFEFAP